MPELVVYLSSLVAAVMVGKAIGYMVGYRAGLAARNSSVSKQYEPLLREIQSSLEKM